MASRWSRFLVLAVRRSNCKIGKLEKAAGRISLCTPGIPQTISIRQVSTAQSQSDKPAQSTSNVQVPTKEKLLRIDWTLEKLTPEILKSRLSTFAELCKADVYFEDRIYNYKIQQRSKLLQHIAKIRMYFRYLSPYNKVERIGSCIYQGEDVIVLLWKLTTLESSFMSYFPSFLTQKEAKLLTSEGALDIHVTPEGEIYKIVNRKITTADREGARVMAKFKEDQSLIQKKKEEKELKEIGEEYVEEQKRLGRL